MEVKIDDRRLQYRQRNRDKQFQYLTPKKYLCKRSKYNMLAKAENKFEHDFDMAHCESEMLKQEKASTYAMLDKYYGKHQFVRKRTARDKGRLKEELRFQPKGPTIGSTLRGLDRMLSHKLMGLLFEYNQRPMPVGRAHRNIERHNHFNNSRLH